MWRGGREYSEINLSAPFLSKGGLWAPVQLCLAAWLSDMNIWSCYLLGGQSRQQWNLEAAKTSRRLTPSATSKGVLKMHPRPSFPSERAETISFSNNILKPPLIAELLHFHQEPNKTWEHSVVQPITTSRVQNESQPMCNYRRESFPRQQAACNYNKSDRMWTWHRSAQQPAPTGENQASWWHHGMSTWRLGDDDYLRCLPLPSWGWHNG